MTLHAHPQQYQRYREDQDHEDPFHVFHEQQTGLVKEITSVNRAAHEAHGLLLDLGMTYAQRRLHGGFVFDTGIANECGTTRDKHGQDDDGGPDAVEAHQVGGADIGKRRHEQEA